MKVCGDTPAPECVETLCLCASLHRPVFRTTRSGPTQQLLSQPEESHEFKALCEADHMTPITLTQVEKDPVDQGWASAQVHLVWWSQTELGQGFRLGVGFIPVQPSYTTGPFYVHRFRELLFQMI